MSRQLHLVSIAMVIVCISCNEPGKKNEKTSGDTSLLEYSPSSTGEMIHNLNALLDEGFYFKFNTTYASCRDQLPDKYKSYFDIFKCEYFGYPEMREKQASRLFMKYYRDLTENEKISYHFSQISHYQKLYAYDKAYAEVLKLEQFADRLDSVCLADLQEYHEKFSALLDVPPLTVRNYPGDTIHMEKIRGHYYVPVSINGNRMKMVFDTGAGWSLISRSMAENFGLEIYETATEVLGTTGVRSASNLGIAKKLTLGKTQLGHVVFQVVEDSLLGVPEYEFFFDGLFGFDLLYSLGSISLNAEGMLKINKHREDPVPANMCISHFDNRIAVTFQDKVLPVKFDTGAWMSIFTWRFYNLFKSTSLKNCMAQTKEYGGIGGEKSLFDMVHLDSMLFFVESDSVLLEDAWIHKKSIRKDPVTYFGLIGQDFIGQFQEITLNFNPNSIEYTPHN